MTARRTTQQRGWVAFPTDRENSGEGGMYVQLVVVPHQRTDLEAPWMLCCGSLPQVTLSECLIHDGVNQTPEVPEPPGDAPPEVWKEYIEKLCLPSAAVAFHYPRFATVLQGDLPGDSDYRSIDYLAVITLGSTGWSNGEWHCTFADLTLDGKRLYSLMEALYAGKGDVYLMTWLDT